MAKKEEEKQAKRDEDWMSKKWRPMMAIMYMACCASDFILFPIMYTVVQFWETEAANDAFRQWTPITLQGGGLFHIAMGAVLGISAYGRTQEKLGGAAGNTPLGTPNATNIPSSGFTASSAPAPSGFGSSSGFGATTASSGFGGTAAPTCSGFGTPPACTATPTTTPAIRPIIKKPT
jgi:hypothetical protein